MRLAIDDAIALLDRGAADRLGEMALAGAGRAEEERVLALLDEAGGGEVVDQRAIHLLVEIEIKAVERAVGIAKARLLVPAREQPVLPALQFVARRASETRSSGASRLGLRLAEARFEDGGHAGESEFAERVIEFDEIHVGVSCLAIDEIAVERELPDERIDLAQASAAPAAGARGSSAGSDRSGTPSSSAALAASSTTAGPCFFASARTPRMRRTPGAPSCCVDVAADGADVRAGARRPRAEQRERRRRRARRPVRVVRCDASRAARADARAAAGRSSDRAAGRAGRSTAPGRAGQSSRAARRSTRPRLRRSHRDAPCGRRSGSSETARAAAAPRAGCSSANIAATWRFVVPWMRVSAQCVSQRSR